MIWAVNNYNFFLINTSVVWSENIKTNVDQRFQKPRMTSSDLLFHSQPSDIQFTVTEQDKKKQRKIHIEKAGIRQFFFFNFLFKLMI